MLAGFPGGKLAVINAANGGAITVSADLLADLVPGSGQVSVSVSPLAALDVPGLLKALDRYPYGCTEQTVSRAMPLLHVNRLASLEHLALDANADERVQNAIERVLARQGANGSFGLWGVGGEDLWLDAFTADFLTRARERQFPVPQTAFNLALDRLRNQVVNTGEIVKEEAAGIAYALYVLARNGRPVMGDLRYLADNKLADFATPLARAQIGAALSALGEAYKIIGDEVYKLVGSLPGKEMSMLEERLKRTTAPSTAGAAAGARPPPTASATARAGPRASVIPSAGTSSPTRASAGPPSSRLARPGSMLPSSAGAAAGARSRLPAPGAAGAGAARRESTMGLPRATRTSTGVPSPRASMLRAPGEIGRAHV